MAYYLVKVLLSALIIVAVSELAKRSGPAAAAVASLPLVSVVAFVWIYLETGDLSRLSRLSLDIAWLLPASLLFFLVLPWLLREGWGFWWSLLTACAATGAAYAMTLLVLRRMG